MLGIVFLTACSNSPRYSGGGYQKKLPTYVTSSSDVRQQLLRQFKRWEGTPYRHGGTSLSGVDCSAFVQNTYRAKFNKRIPRTTRTQIKVGKKVKKSQLRVGDVVFFKTGRSSMHNGIYMGNATFMHASSSKGVTISNLNNRYWRKRYLTSRRIL
ncbi:MAG: NlpC/P60 family protein [Thiomicrorhabdus sp.]|nr:NlpC/P60 family protein [Thiomicrorhabdus sp.]